MKLVILASLMVANVALGAGKEIKPVGKAKAPAANAAAEAKTKSIAPTQLDLLKGEWTDCRPDPNFVGDVDPKDFPPKLRDLYTRVSTNSFTQTIGKAKDKDCKATVSNVRTTFECEVFSPELLTCISKKVETNVKGGKWIAKSKPVDENGTQNSFKLAIVQRDPDTLVLTFTSDGSEESETFELKKSSK